MSKIISRIFSLFSSRNSVGVDKSGNRYFTRIEKIDDISGLLYFTGDRKYIFLYVPVKEKRSSGRSTNSNDQSMNISLLSSYHNGGFMAFLLYVPVKEKRWVIFKGEQDPTTVPVEWICWLNGQRKKAPTPEEMNDMEARRERVRLNVALLKKEEEEKKAKGGSSVRKGPTTGKTVGTDLKSFIQQFPADSKDEKPKEASESTDPVRSRRESESDEAVPESTEPTGSGASFRPGTWQPPT